MKVIPDEESLANVERAHPTLTDAEKFRLAQADTLLRWTKPRSIEELTTIVQSEPIRTLIREHSQR